MARDKVQAESIRKSVERTARRELDRHERRQRQESEDPDLNRRAILKRRLNWKKKFNIFILAAAVGSLATMSVSETASQNGIKGADRGAENETSGLCSAMPVT